MTWFGGRLTQVETRLLSATGAVWVVWRVGMAGMAAYLRGESGCFVYHHVCCVLFHCKAGVLGAPAPGGDPNMSCVLVSLHIMASSHTLASATTPSNDLLSMCGGRACLWTNVGMWGFHFIQPLSLIRGTVRMLRNVDILCRPVSMRCWWLAFWAAIKLRRNQFARECTWLLVYAGFVYIVA